MFFCEFHLSDNHRNNTKQNYMTEWKSLCNSTTNNKKKQTKKKHVILNATHLALFLRFFLHYQQNQQGSILRCWFGEESYGDKLSPLLWPQLFQPFTVTVMDQSIAVIVTTMYHMGWASLKIEKNTHVVAVEKSDPLRCEVHPQEQVYTLKQIYACIRWLKGKAKHLPI